MLDDILMHIKNESRVVLCGNPAKFVATTSLAILSTFSYISHTPPIAT